MEKKDFYYVENAVRVLRGVDNQVIKLASAYFQNTKETLLVLRKGHVKSNRMVWAKVRVKETICRRVTKVFSEYTLCSLLRTDYIEYTLCS